MKLHTIIDNQPSTSGVWGNAGVPGITESSGSSVAAEAPGAAARLAYEHGLCLCFSMDGKNYLVDTGASGAFVGNMELLAENGMCNAEDIDAVFISHAHNDHTGGLRKFLERNSKAQVYLHNSIRGNYFYSCRPKNGIREARNIGMEQALFTDYSNRFTEIGAITCITDKITLIPSSERREFPTPMGNEFLYCNDFPDNFSHEVAIVVEYAPEEFAVISPCSHSGILNILQDCNKWIEGKYGRNTIYGSNGNLSGSKNCSQMMKHFIGGLHYVDYLLMGQGEKEAASILETASIIKEKYPLLKIHSGHCTCTRASGLLGMVLGENYDVFCTGTSIDLN